VTARIAAIVAFLAGLFMAAQYFVKTDFTILIYRAILDYYQVIFAVTMLVGGISMLKHHSAIIASRQEGKFYSGLAVGGVLFMIIAAAMFGTGTNSPYQWAFNNLQAPMQATMFSLLAFFVASAAYRGFRIRSKPALVLALTAVIVLIGRSAFGDLISDRLPELAGWIFNNPSSAAKRGILIGVGLGSVATALRVILGIERSYM
jgi:hypothetical protein